MPEEDLQTKQAELDGLLDRLAQNELGTLHAKINSFISTYNDAGVHKVGEAKELRADMREAPSLDTITVHHHWTPSL